MARRSAFSRGGLALRDGAPTCALERVDRESAKVNQESSSAGQESRAGQEPSSSAEATNTESAPA